MKKNIINLNKSTGKVSSIPRGRNGGRILESLVKIKAEKTIKLYQLGVPVIVICNDLKISRSTLYRYLKYDKLHLAGSRNRKKMENQ
jgi:DNA invertase Pin-like site-specific DNA recombinase